MHIRELDGKMGGRPVELLRVDDESDPTKAQSSVNRLLGREQVDMAVDDKDRLLAEQADQVAVRTPQAVKGLADMNRNLTAMKSSLSTPAGVQPVPVRFHAVSPV